MRFCYVTKNGESFSLGKTSWSEFNLQDKIFKHIGNFRKLNQKILEAFVIVEKVFCPWLDFVCEKLKRRYSKEL